MKLKGFVKGRIDNLIAKSALAAREYIYKPEIDKQKERIAVLKDLCAEGRTRAAERYVFNVCKATNENFGRVSMQTKGMGLAPERTAAIKTKCDLLREHIFHSGITKDDLDFLNEVDVLYDELFKWLESKTDKFVADAVADKMEGIKGGIADGKEHSGIGAGEQNPAEQIKKG